MRAPTGAYVPCRARRKTAGKRRPCRLCRDGRLAQGPLGLHSLAGEEAFESGAVHAEDTADSNGIEPSVVYQPPDRLGVHSEPTRYFADAIETGVAVVPCHAGPSSACHAVPRNGRAARLIQ